MGFLDSLKNAASAIATGAAKVNLAPVGGAGAQGQEMHVAVSAVSTGPEVKHEGVYIDLVGTETVTVAGTASAKESVKLTIKLTGAGVIAAGQGASWVGTVKIPTEMPPTYAGPQAKHEVTMNARLDTAGSDPQSGPQPLIVLRRPGA